MLAIEPKLSWVRFIKLLDNIKMVFVMWSKQPFETLQVMRPRSSKDFNYLTTKLEREFWRCTWCHWLEIVRSRDQSKSHFKALVSNSNRRRTLIAFTAALIQFQWPCCFPAGLAQCHCRHCQHCWVCAQLMSVSCLPVVDFGDKLIF